MKLKQKAFTIVELLIVIVIVGILAAIVIVAYNGIQARAGNVDRIATYQQVHRLVSMYQTLNGTAPPKSSLYHTCVGVGWKDSNSDGIKDCFIANGTVDTDFRYDATLNNALKTISPKLPEPSSSIKYKNGTNNYEVFSMVAIVSGNSAQYEDGTPIAMVLTGHLAGNDQDCGANSVRAVSATTGITRYAVMKNAGSFDNATICNYAVNKN